MKVKICGITNIDDAFKAVELGADALGFIFYKKSKRYIEPEFAKDIINFIPALISTVGVFVNEEKNIIDKVISESGINTIQLHGEESPKFADAFNLPVIKSFRIDDNFNFQNLDQYKNCTFLLDTYTDSEYGGTGKIFKWDLIPNNLRSKIILAGGISSENISEIKTNISPYAVDLSSSVEKSPGVKDHTKLEEFFKTNKQEI